MKAQRRRGWRYFRNLGIALLVALLFAFYVIFPAYSAYVLVHLRRPVCCISPADVGITAYEDVTIKTGDGLTVSGWYSVSRNGAAIIAVHGSNGNRTNVLNHAALLARHGYGVLMIDLRGNGNSDGELVTPGWNSNEDIEAAIAYLNARPDVVEGKIGGIGLSMGSEVLLRAAAQSDHLKAIVSDGAGASTVGDYLALPGGSKWFLAPFIWVQYTTIGLLTNVPQPVALRDTLPKIASTRVLFIAGGVSRGGQEAALNQVFYDSTSAPKTFWIIAGAGHTAGLVVDAENYEAKVSAFFDEALLGVK